MKPLKIFLAIAGAILLFSCLQPSHELTTSTSVTTGNPTGIRIIFQKDAGSISLSGKAEIFAATQIPVPGYGPNPLLRINFIKSRHADIGPNSIDSIPDSLWPASSLEGDSIRKFNVVISSDTLGLILRGFGFKRTTTGVEFMNSGNLSYTENSNTEVIADLAKLTEFVGKVDTNRLLPTGLVVYYVFIYGTGFAAKMDGGLIKIPGLPMGQHEAFLTSLPGKDGPISRKDSTTVFSLLDLIGTAKDSIIRGPVYERLELPDSLKHP